MFMKPYRLFVFLFLFLMAACGPSGPVEFVPTETPNPLAFFQPTAISPGKEGNPLQMVFAPPDPETVGEAGSTLGTALASSSGLLIEVVTVPTDAEALDIFCNYNDEDRFAAVWLNAALAVIAEARGCGDVVLQGVRDGNTGLVGEIIAQRGISSVNNLSERVFCRLDVDDFYSWVLPSLALRSLSFDPTDLGDIQDYLNYPSLVENVAEGNCDAAGVPSDIRAEEDTGSQVAVIYETLPMPYGVLLYPPELLLDDRVALTDAYLELAGFVTDEEADAGEETPLTNLSPEREALLSLLGADQVTPISESEFEEIRAFMQSTGLNLAGLGRE